MLMTISMEFEEMSALNPVEADVEVGDAGGIGFGLCESAVGHAGSSASHSHEARCRGVIVPASKKAVAPWPS